MQFEAFQSKVINFCKQNSFYLIGKQQNTRVYDLISVPQITRLLLGDAIISSKTDPHNSSKKEMRAVVKVKIIKTY